LCFLHGFLFADKSRWQCLVDHWMEIGRVALGPWEKTWRSAKRFAADAREVVAHQQINGGLVFRMDIKGFLAKQEYTSTHK
jgi:hypothetical protein